jgi:hypothetical protein
MLSVMEAEQGCTFSIGDELDSLLLVFVEIVGVRLAL